VEGLCGRGMVGAELEHGLECGAHGCWENGDEGHDGRWAGAEGVVHSYAIDSTGWS